MAESPLQQHRVACPTRKEPVMEISLATLESVTLELESPELIVCACEMKIAGLMLRRNIHGEGHSSIAVEEWTGRLG